MQKEYYWILDVQLHRFLIPTSPHKLILHFVFIEKPTKIPFKDIFQALSINTPFSKQSSVDLQMYVNKFSPKFEYGDGFKRNFSHYRGRVSRHWARRGSVMDYEFNDDNPEDIGKIEISFDDIIEARKERERKEKENNNSE